MDGRVSPCTPLFYDSESYLDQTLRRSRACHYGDLNTGDLADIWMNEDYKTLRRKLQFEEFSHAPYVIHVKWPNPMKKTVSVIRTPHAGGCLWQQGFIQCP